MEDIGDIEDIEDIETQRHGYESTAPVGAEDHFGPQLTIVNSIDYSTYFYTERKPKV